MTLTVTNMEGVGDCAPPSPIDPSCPVCGASFKRTRKDKRYCSKKCARKPTRNARRGTREAEYKASIGRSYKRAAWLAYDVLRMRLDRQNRTILTILEAASGPDADLRRILTDPELLSARWGDPKGKVYPDNSDKMAPNIAKLVNTFCRQEWGCSVHEAIFDDGKPAWRKFVEAHQTETSSKVPPDIYEETLEPYERRDPTEFLAHLKEMRMTKEKIKAA